MVKVIIVDDENIVRLGLKTLIDWEMNGFEILSVLKMGKMHLHIVVSLFLHQNACHK